MSPTLWIVVAVALIVAAGFLAVIAYVVLTAIAALLADIEGMPICQPVSRR